jgi:hypothetical protein
MADSFKMDYFNQELNLDDSTWKVDALPLCYYKWNNTFKVDICKYLGLYFIKI